MMGKFLNGFKLRRCFLLCFFKENNGNRGVDVKLWFGSLRKSINVTCEGVFSAPNVIENVKESASIPPPVHNFQATPTNEQNCHNLTQYFASSSFH